MTRRYKEDDVVCYGIDMCGEAIIARQTDHNAVILKAWRLRDTHEWVGYLDGQLYVPEIMLHPRPDEVWRDYVMWRLTHAD